MSKIFKAYDVRGIYPQEINEEIVYKIGKGFIEEFGFSNVVVGRDVRKSSESLFKALCKGICDSGANVIEIGVVSTPLIYFAVSKYNYDGAIMVTASHNPAEYNGLKFTREKGIPIFYANGINKVHERIGNIDDSSVEIRGKVIQIDVLKDFEDWILRSLKPIKDLNVVLDFSNGMGGIFANTILKSLPINFHFLNEDLDGSFPNHPPNPAENKNLIQAKNKILEVNADFGAVFDGDCDRVFFLDEKGERVAPDILMSLLGEFLLKDSDKKVIVHDLRSSWAAKENLVNNGAKLIETKVGYPSIKSVMRNNDALFGGELSGHFFFGDNNNNESPIRCLLILVEILTSKGLKLSEIVKPFNKFFPTGEINIEVEDADLVLQKIEEKFSDYDVCKLDGIKVTTDDFWFNVRKSNTEPIIRITAEGRTNEAMEKIKAEILEIAKN